VYAWIRISARNVFRNRELCLTVIVISLELDFHPAHDQEGKYRSRCRSTSTTYLAECEESGEDGSSGINCTKWKTSNGRSSALQNRCKGNPQWESPRALMIPKNALSLSFSYVKDLYRYVCRSGMYTVLYTFNALEVVGGPMVMNCRCNAPQSSIPFSR
jgi:hypothetical protein